VVGIVPEKTFSSDLSDSMRQLICGFLLLFASVLVVDARPLTFTVGASCGYDVLIESHSTYEDSAELTFVYDTHGVFSEVDVGSGATNGGLFKSFCMSLAAKTAGEAERLVIGRGADLAKPGALGPGEFKFSWPPTGTVRTEWKVNSGLLRQEMGNMRPIRDASVGNNGGMYLNAERNLLRDRGWTFDANTSLWMPPTPAP
jgi:hypothetical protein